VRWESGTREEAIFVVFAWSSTDAAASHGVDFALRVTLNAHALFLLTDALFLPAFPAAVEDGGVFGEDSFADDVAPVAFEEADFAAAREVAEVLAFAAEVLVDDVAGRDALDAREEGGGEGGVGTKVGFEDADVKRAEIGVREGVVKEVF